MNKIKNGVGGWYVAPSMAGLSIAIAVAGLAAGMAEYLAQQSKLDELERNAALTSKVAEADMFRCLLHQLGNGQNEQMKTELSNWLADDFQQLRASEASADAGTHECIETACCLILQDERAHPQYFLPARSQVPGCAANGPKAIDDQPLAFIKPSNSPARKSVGTQAAENN
ncbi:MAG TPA: hypothetical protein VH598_14680 [Verrucomicrobiae bacterium]|nr:hypothetical protein [Verrucomicrobiae bacterium]